MADKPQNRKEIVRHGERGRWVRVVAERSTGLFLVQWKVPGKPKQQQSFRERGTAKSFAEGLAEQLRKGPVVRPLNLTMQQMWDRYVVAEFPHLRENTKRIYADNYRTWCLHFGWDFIAEHTTPEMADELRRSLTADGWAINSMRKVIYDVKRVFAWAESRELIQRNRLRLYKFKVAKEDRPLPPPEYRADELAAILAQFDPSDAFQWRPWVALTLCGNQGARQHAVLHLEPADCTERLITWRAEWDKNGVEWTQPMRPQSWLAVQVALAWREKLGYTGRWLIAPGRNSRWATHPDATYTKDALWTALTEAEKRAGIPKLARRGAHGFRRLLAGDVAALTGDPLMALRAIGDKDVRMAERYIQNRPDQVRDAFERLDRKAGEGKPNTSPKRDALHETGVPDDSDTPATPSNDA